VFEKDIRRVFIYKKAERLAKAIHLIAPAFNESLSLRNRLDSIAIGLVDAAILPHSAARGALSRELLALSSVLSIARTGGILSVMNVELIAREAHLLLQEVAAYEEPRLFLEDAPSLSAIAKNASQSQPKTKPPSTHALRPIKAVSDSVVTGRKDAVLSVIKDKGRVGIKDISVIIRGVSEKTIQRELASLIAAGTVRKEGERRWSTYSLAS